jgi:dTDP-4-dehydrorhamnose reductase
LRILVTGTEGQIARALAERGPEHGVNVRLIGRPELDLTIPGTISKSLEAGGGDVVVNAAAYTAVDQAEAEPQLAHAVNETGAELVAEAAARGFLPIVHLSTDYVFDGTADNPYREDDPTRPLGIYGQSKLAGEHAVTRANPNSVILRTAWVYSPFGKNFVKTMLHLALNRDEVAVVADQRGSPTSALDIADTVIGVCRQLVSRPHDAQLRGVFHMAGTGETTWADLAEFVFDQSRQFGGPTAIVRRITTAEYPVPAKRPMNSRLDSSKLATHYDIRLPSWRPSVRVCVQRLLEAANQKENP